MQIRALLVPSLFLLGLSHSSILIQAQQNVVPEPRFALEISEPNGHSPRYMPIWERGVSSTLSSERRPDWKSTDPQHPQATASRLVVKVEGDTVVLTATVILGPFDFSDTPRSLEGVPQEELAKYTLRLNESVTLRELEQFGLLPTTVKVVTVKPSVPTPLQVRSMVPSIRIDAVEEDQRESYKVTLRNLSPRAVTGLAYGPEDNSGGGQTGGDASHPILLPGATYELRVSFGHSGRMTSAGFVEDVKPFPGYLITGALFDDDSFEGESLAVAEMEVSHLAFRVQSERAEQLVDSIIQDETIDDDAKIARIRSEVPKLSEEPDPSILAGIHARHPDLPRNADKFLSPMLKGGFSNGKQTVLYALRDYERNNKNGPPKMSLARWWSGLRKH
jgi:hypothetical protein